MKTSIKLLTITATCLLLMLVAGLIVIKYSLESIQKETKEAKSYRDVKVDKFENIELRGLVDVIISQGDNYSLKISPAHDTSYIVKNANDTLFLIRKNNGTIVSSATVYAKITVPSLKGIRTEEDAKILLQSFKGDSLVVELKDRSVFNEKNISFKHKSILTEGRVSIKTEGLKFK